MGNIAGFNAAEVDPNVGFDLIPSGQYVAVITESELKPTSTGEGQRLALTLQICSGEYQNRKLFDNLNLHSHGPNRETTEKIARGTLSSICRSVGVMTPNDSSELHMKPMRVTVGIEVRKDNGEKQNRIRKYEAMNAGPSEAVATQPAAAASYSESTKTPW